MKRELRKFVFFLKNFFLPTERNQNFPYALRLNNLAFVVLLALVIKSLSFATWLVLPKLPFFADVSSGLIVHLTNQERQVAGVSPVKESPVLTQAAYQKAQDMISKNYFSHNSPDGLSPWYWFSKNDYTYKYAGENLAIDFFESRDVVNAWMNSPTHRFNVLNQNYQEIGVAVAAGNIEGHETTLVVQLFGTPKTVISQALIPSPSPTSAKSPAVLLTPAIKTPTPEFSPAVAGEEVKTPVSPYIEATGSPELVLSPELSPTASPGFAGLGTKTNLPRSPQLTQDLLSLAIDPSPVLFGLASYLGLALIFGIFSKIYTPYPKAIIGAVLSIIIVIGIAYMPGALQMFHLSAKVVGA
jgi:hypothetical protein